MKLFGRLKTLVEARTITRILSQVRVGTTWQAAGGLT